VSAEKGFVTVLELTHRRRTHDFDQWRLSAEAVMRGYLSFPVFGYANHVLAARLAVGASEGHERSPEFFGLGGVPGRGIDIIAGLEIGGGSQYPIRGLSEGVRYGDRIVSAALEYRLPIVLVGRGYGLWPVMLDRLSLSLFADAGSAWSNGDAIDVLTSVGSEVSLDLGLSYALVYRFRFGIALPAGDTDESWSVYASTGVAF
jgi:outer membrane protein assembly factor BamA